MNEFLSWCKNPSSCNSSQLKAIVAKLYKPELEMMCMLYTLACYRRKKFANTTTIKFLEMSGGKLELLNPLDSRSLMSFAFEYCDTDHIDYLLSRPYLTFDVCDYDPKFGNHLFASLKNIEMFPEKVEKIASYFKNNINFFRTHLIFETLSEVETQQAMLRCLQFDINDKIVRKCIRQAARMIGITPHEVAIVLTDRMQLKNYLVES